MTLYGSPGVWEVFVAGVPVPQGSVRAFVVRSALERQHGAKGRAVVTHAARSVQAWRAEIAAAVRAVVPAGCLAPRGVPVALVLRFDLPRVLARRRESVHVVKPDLDKLARGVLDALTGIVYDDDSQVHHLTVTKRRHSGTGPGVFLRIMLGAAVSPDDARV